jgi:hypothetical protein
MEFSREDMYSRSRSFTSNMVSLQFWYGKQFPLISGGPIIRITPEEIHINDVGFLDTVYAPSTSRRDKYTYQLRSLRVPGGVGAAARFDVHKRRRDALSSFFSKRNIVYLEPVITEKVDQLCRLIAKYATQKTPVNLSDAFYAFSNEYGFQNYEATRC